MPFKRIIFHVLLFVAAASAFTACQSTGETRGKSNKTGGSQNVAAGGGATPTEAFRNLYAAVKSKNTEAIKANMSKATIELIDFQVQLFKKTPEQVVEYGMIQATSNPNPPPIRNERVKDNMGALEAQGADGRWDYVPFIKEDGVWKLAVGNVLNRTHADPEQPAAQTGGNPNAPPTSNASGETNAVAKPGANQNQNKSGFERK